MQIIDFYESNNDINLKHPLLTRKFKILVITCGYTLKGCWQCFKINTAWQQEINGQKVVNTPFYSVKSCIIHFN